ncbi:MAG: DUF2934 domain-containing protein [Kiritimatiellia bacterium]
MNTPVPETGEARQAESVRSGQPPSAEERFRQIQEAAYLLAEKDGFRQDPTVYWLAAEAEFLKGQEQQQ